MFSFSAYDVFPISPFLGTNHYLPPGGEGEGFFLGEGGDDKVLGRKEGDQSPSTKLLQDVQNTGRQVWSH